MLASGLDTATAHGSGGACIDDAGVRGLPSRGARTTSGRLLVLKTGAVEIMKDGMQITEVSEPGAVFGELSMLLDQPHTADVRALEVTEFHVADAASLLTDDPATLLCVTVLLARRLDATNQALILVKHQLHTGQPRSIISRTVVVGFCNPGCRDKFEQAVAHFERATHRAGKAPRRIS